MISLLNAVTGPSAAAGLALDNTHADRAGMIVGASGTILTKLMAEAKNRSIPAIVAAFGGTATAPGAENAATHARPRRRRRGDPDHA